MLHTTIGSPAVIPSPAPSSTNFTRQLKYGAGNAVDSGRQFLDQFVNSNPKYLNFLGAIGGAATVAIGILCFLNVFNAFQNPLTYVLNIFYIFFGGAMFITSVFGSTGLAQKIYSHANFLSNPLGRSFVYLYLGCLMTSSGFTGKISWLYVVVGIYMLGLSILSFIVSRSQNS